MCYPKPGPRCSAHAAADLAAARQHLEQLSNDNDVSDAALKDAYQREVKAQENFDATPKGMDALRRSIEQDKGAGFQRIQLQTRLLTGIDRRNDALDAYHKGLQTERTVPSHHLPVEGQKLVSTERRATRWGRKGEFYEHTWGTNSEGEPVFFAKVHYYVEAEDAPARLVLCDIEKNPDAHGMSGPQFMRLLARQYGVENVEFTGAFTDAGYGWYERVASEGAPVRLESGAVVENHYGEMTFVESWKDAQPTYGL